MSLSFAQSKYGKVFVHHVAKRGHDKTNSPSLKVLLSEKKTNKLPLKTKFWKGWRASCILCHHFAVELRGVCRFSFFPCFFSYLCVFLSYILVSLSLSFFFPFLFLILFFFNSSLPSLFLSSVNYFVTFSYFIRMHSYTDQVLLIK